MLPRCIIPDKHFVASINVPICAPQQTIIVSESFAGKNLVARHRLVNAALADESGALPFHSLTILAKTPDQWSTDKKIPSSPQCAGGDGRGLLR